MSQPNSKPLHLPPGLALILGVIAASTSAVLVRFAQAEVSSLVISALRLSFAAILLLPIVLTRDRSHLPSIRRKQVSQAALAGFFLAVHFATWITSLEFTNVTSSVVIVQTNPLFVALLSPLLLRERLSRLVIIGMGIALLGSSIVGLSDICTFQPGLVCPDLNSFFAGDAIKGDLLALAGAISGALYLIIGRKVRTDLDLIPYISLVYTSAAIILILVMFLSGQNPFGYSLTSYLWILLLALFPQLLAHSTYNWALGHLPATIVSLSLLGEPVSAALLAYLLLGEAPTGLRIGGAVLVLFGIGLAVLKNRGSREPAGHT